eukprot:Gregarina_sp_Poly_1__3446@NODE_19_length_21533_cov_161_091167_g17_i0_p6_GENE_NODE_19_length_21533_cov_161_091167_g17_i0NODE_19_length_21533_cov_161_091167_g17_i0_p6_ORF_typecomplete_len480_score48_72zfCCCH/PF00642_24/1_1e04zfCCCH/PF00642_24/0_034zfCCCH/PF00642_24/0_00032zfCCCH_3/PF15663_5/3_5e05PSII_Pbs31/PF18240_1/0_14Torus/PF16131_5/1_9Torus/PF16131_5/2_1Cleaved_Adhesin/PF07675_11/4_5Cleaved_Adhesin/PF07675_11/1_2e02Cleaved_Adhesin/PF07675_11/3_8e03_NODE_19_length_21533_cov_161_091167_g17_i084
MTMPPPSPSCSRIPNVPHSRCASSTSCGGNTLLCRFSDQPPSIPPPPAPDQDRLKLPHGPSSGTSTHLVTSHITSTTARANSFAGNLSYSLFSSQPSSENFARSPNSYLVSRPFNLVVNQDDELDDSKNSKNRGQQRKRFFKTRLCPYHFKKGSACKGGVHCSYAHSFSELRPSVDLTKTKLCHDFLSGICHRRAEECPFAHGNTELRPVRPTLDGSGCLLTLPDNPYGRCATSNDLWEITKLPAPLDRAHTFETHATLGNQAALRTLGTSSGCSRQGYLASDLHAQSSMLENYTPSPATPLNSSSKYLLSPKLELPGLLTSSKSTDTAISTQSSGPLITPRARQALVPTLSDQQTTQLLANLSPASDLVNEQSPLDVDDKAGEVSTLVPNAASHFEALAEADGQTAAVAARTALDQTAAVAAPRNNLDLFSSPAFPGTEDEPKLTLTVSQLANIILAAHSAESPADLVNDVLSYIYKT